MRGGRGGEEHVNRCASHLQQLLNVSLLAGTLNAEQGPPVHLAGPLRLPEGQAARHVVEVRDLVAGTLGTPGTHRLT